MQINVKSAAVQKGEEVQKQGKGEQKSGRVWNSEKAVCRGSGRRLLDKGLQTESPQSVVENTRKLPKKPGSSNLLSYNYPIHHLIVPT